MKKYVWILTILLFAGVVMGAIDAYHAEIHRGWDMGLKLQRMNNASYPDGNDVNNITMIYNSLANSFFIFWDEFENYTHGGRDFNTSEIMISSSSDFVNWTGAKRDIVVSFEDGTNATNPAAVFDPYDGSIDLLWSEMNKTSHHREIYFGQSYDGVNWSSARGNHIVTNNYDDKVSDCIFPSIAADEYGEYLHGAWLGMDSNTGTWEVYYGNHSIQGGGDLWSSENNDTIISREDSNNATKPTILVDSSAPARVWIFWSEYNRTSGLYEIYAANRTYGERTWLRRIVYSGINETGNVTAIENFPYIYLFWEEKYNGHFEIYSMGYNESSNIWGMKSLVSYPDGYDARNPSASANGTYDGVFVVWDEFDERIGYREIMISNLTPTGWSGARGDINVTGDPFYHSNPRIYAGQNGEIYLSWIEYTIYGKPRGSREIFTLSAGSGEVIPELHYLLLCGVFVYVLWKRRRT